MRGLIKKVVEEGMVSWWTIFLKDEEITESSVQVRWATSEYWLQDDCPTTGFFQISPAVPHPAQSFASQRSVHVHSPDPELHISND
jgi:hypothetical protein